VHSEYLSFSDKSDKPNNAVIVRLDYRFCIHAKHSYIRIYAYSTMDPMSQGVELFKALSDETRLKLVILLQKRELCVCQIEAALGISQTKASRHLSILRRAGLLRARRDGLWMYYTLVEPRNDLEECLFKNLGSAFCDELATMVCRADAKACNIQSTCSESESIRNAAMPKTGA
jgi:DNA-binding transcriptional ArsR family regulator